jgi:hypothetical protein
MLVLILWKTASVDRSHLLISNCRFTTVEEMATDVIGRLVVQLFHHINTGRSLL